MEIYVKDGRLQVLDFNVSTKSDLRYEVVVDVSLQEIAKILKPYLDEIDNCEVCKKWHN